MGALEERVRLNLLVYGNGIEDNFKNNSLFFAEKYSKSDKLVTAMDTVNMKTGGFYFLHYLLKSIILIICIFLLLNFLFTINRTFSNLLIIDFIKFKLS